MYVNNEYSRKLFRQFIAAHPFNEPLLPRDVK